MARVVLDAMGGDSAPDVIIEGVRIFRQEDDTTEIFLTGPIERLEPATKDIKCTLVPASEVVGMHESPSAAVKTKRDSSIAKGIGLVKENQADAFVTMGNSGAAIAFALFQLGRLPGVSRPGLMTPMPSKAGRTLVCDVGAVVDCKPEHLLHFAVLVSVYSSEVYQTKNPRVGLLSIGEERSKGNELTNGAYTLLEKSGLNFIGYVEGNDIAGGKADVVICDGFVGNVILKFGEGIVDYVFAALRQSLRHVLEESHADAETSKQRSDFFKSVVSSVDYAEIGCAPLMGVNGLCFVGHGRSQPRAVANAIRTARNAAAHRSVIERQRDTIQEVLARIEKSPPVLA